jgi:WD40 repeat protein
VQPGHAGESLAGQEVGAMPMDLDYEAEIEVKEQTSEADMQCVPKETDNAARPKQPIAKKQESIPSDNWVLSLLKECEMYGTAPVRVARGQKSFKATTYAFLEDSFTQQNEWTDCSGDIASISWITEDAFLCGALAHLDPHNMQYNKPGNLLLGSTTQDTLRSFADHRLVRPLVDKAQNAENASDSMRRTQDPWIYPSVVSTAHCKKNGFSFTASFDQTVKIWSIANDGTSMDLVGTWKHEGKVNFVVTSDHHERVATASEVNSNAVRVYNFDEDSVSESAYDLYCGNKSLEQIGEIRRRDTWSYQPATIQWGKAPQVANLILVGYSPRSETGDDVDIPDDKKNTGELCVWNAESGAPITISSGRTQNVFEVQWHPTQPIFVVATSPCGIFDTEKTKTQIRLFALNESNVFMNIQALDCPALDINELTIM